MGRASEKARDAHIDVAVLLAPFGAIIGLLAGRVLSLDGSKGRAG